MNNFIKIGLIIVIILAGIYVKMAFFGSPDVIEDNKQISEETSTEKNNEQPQKEDKLEYQTINVFFIAHNSAGEEVYRAVKRDYLPEYGSQLKFAVKSLINGPSEKEKKAGVYTEIPAGTRLISITETPSRVVINLTSEFENGGGTDGIYKRLFQLIKTVKLNSNLPLYLQLDGKQVDVIGGEGVMINQPLSEEFANE
ncbi:GerMN domain-containing protein [bacterium]|nr:GerMN domain-containing protein [bacterium]